MKYSELKDLVKLHTDNYYAKSSSTITDTEFDALYDELVRIESQQKWADYDSPTQKVGFAVAGGNKVKHPFALFSLKKTYIKEDIGSEFDVKTPKIDGTNLSLIYRFGVLSLALTRGDGEFGENVSHLVIGNEQFTQSIPIKTSLLVFNGECATLNKVENFRNYVSGALGLKDANEFKNRNLVFIVHDVFGTSADYTDRLTLAKELGFYTVLNEHFCRQFPQDGVVYRVDSTLECMKLGYTSKYPRFAIALKERNQLLETSTLIDVQWSIGRTGTVNPVAIIEPVILDGATISRVTLHNMDFVLEHNLGIGDIVLIERAGGIIPKLVKVLKHSHISMKITKENAEKALGIELIKDGPRLVTRDIGMYQRQIVEHFIKTMEIKGLGSQSIKKLDITSISDIYKELRFSLVGASGVKIQEEIELSKNKPYSLVLASLGILGVGKTAAKKIVNEIPDFNHLNQLEYLKIPGIGPVITNSILTWFELNKEWALRLPLKFIEEDQDYKINENSSCKELCITGKLDKSRDEISKHFENLGFTVKSTVTKNCYALITDDVNGSSSKLKKAKEYGVKILSYWDDKDTILAGNF